MTRRFMPGRARRLALGALVLAGCAGGPEEDLPRIERATIAWSELWPELASGPTAPNAMFPARSPGPEQVKALQAAEKLYRAKDDEGFAAARDALAEDPLAAFWLARMLVRDTVLLRERVPIGGGEEVMVGLAPWRRPFEQLVAMGAPAVPCVVLDLLRDRRANRRKLGVEVLRDMGSAAFGELEPVLRLDDDLVRAAAVESVAGWEWTPRVAAALRAATDDAFFGVRAAAWSGFANGGAAAAEELRAALAVESDPFVRQAMLRALGGHRDPRNARVLRTAYDRALVEGDEDTLEAALGGLRTMSGDPRLVGPDAVRDFVESLSAGGSDGSIGNDR